jgi:hypothetical protein
MHPLAVRSILVKAGFKPSPKSPKRAKALPGFKVYKDILNANTTQVWIFAEHPPLWMNIAEAMATAISTAAPQAQIVKVRDLFILVTS